MGIYNREDYNTALPQLEKRIKQLEDNGIYVAKVNKTTYREVVQALKDGKIPFAITSNSYDTFNVYPYSFAGTGALYFGRMHGSANAPAYKLAVLTSDNTWTTYTTNLATT